MEKYDVVVLQYQAETAFNKSIADKVTSLLNSTLFVPITFSGRKYDRIKYVAFIAYEAAKDFDFDFRDLTKALKNEMIQTSPNVTGEHCVHGCDVFVIIA